MVAAPKGAGELAIQKKRHPGFHRARPDRVVWNQSRDRGFDEGDLRGLEENIPGAAGLWRRIRGTFLPRNLAPDCLFRCTELAVMYGRAGTSNGGHGAREQKSTSVE